MTTRVDDPDVSFPPLIGSHAACPCCGRSPLAEFYRVRDVPVQSNALLTSHEQAAGYPRGQLRLAFCRACGFITNTAFDAALADRPAGYEATQACSATFGAFARRLASQWIERFDLRRKHVLEIGCGQGEFLALLCTLGDNHGVGFDPRFDPTRHPAPGDARVWFVQDRYSDAYADLPADFVCCRQALAHIPDAGEFVRMVRHVIGGREGTAVGFEVPDTLHVLREGAFWDIDYQHCSYFTPGSLARLFRAAGFEVTGLRLEDEGQHLILEAKPAAGSARPRLELEDDLAAVTDAVEGFGSACARQILRWRRVVDENVADGNRVVLWGAGSKAAGFLTTTGLGPDRVPCVVDIDPQKQGTFLPTTGQPVVGPETLRDVRPDVVIALNPVVRGEIRGDLDRLGVRADVLEL